MSDVMIEARDLSKRYGPVTAISGVGFQVRKGEVLGFLGPNGAGKTTIMKILTCFIAPSEGTAKVAGFDIFDDSVAVRRAIGYLPESNALYTEMLVIEYLDFAARMRGFRGDEAHKRIKRAVEETAIGDVLGKEIRTLSKGYRQRVGLAQALVHEPPVVILDEPMSGLDPNQAVEIRDLIKTIGKERTVVLSTHNLAEVQVTCGRVLIIARGKIVADDSPQALMDSAGKATYVVSVLRAAALDTFRDGGAPAIRRVFADLKGVDRVRDVTSDDEELHYQIVPATDDDLRPAIFKAAVDAKLTMVGLRKEARNLEQIFRELTQQEGDGGDEGARKSTKKGAKAGKAAAKVEAPPPEPEEEDEEEEEEAEAAAAEPEAKKPAEPEPKPADDAADSGEKKKD